MSNIRPIALLDTFRKITKILTKRLSSLCQEHNILQGLNFCGLKGKVQTDSPLHIINNVIEDAKQKNGEAWIITQDMRFSQLRRVEISAKQNRPSTSFYSLDPTTLFWKKDDKLLRILVLVRNSLQWTASIREMPSLLSSGEYSTIRY